MEDILWAKPGALYTSVHQSQATLLKKTPLSFLLVIGPRPRDAKGLARGHTAVCGRAGLGSLVGLISQFSSTWLDCDKGKDNKFLPETGLLVNYPEVSLHLFGHPVLCLP